MNGVVVQIPTLPEAGGYAPREIDLHLTGDQAVKLCRIRCGLQVEGAHLAGCGRVIRDNAEAVVFLIEQATAEEATAEEATVEEATAEEATAEEATAEEPTAEEATAKEATAKEPTAKEPTASE